MEDGYCRLYSLFLDWALYEPESFLLGGADLNVHSSHDLRTLGA